MSRIALLTRSYHNSQSANAICAGNIAEALRELGHEVFIISYESENSVPNDSSVYYLSLLQEEKRTKRLFSRLLGILKLLVGSVDQIIDRRIVDLYYERLNQLESACHLDVIVSFSFPLETVQAVTMFKKKNATVRTIVYELDSSGDGISQSRFPALYNRSIRQWFRKSYQSVDLIIIMQSHKEYWLKRFGEKYGRKARFSDIPVLKRHLQDCRENKPRGCIMVYAGLIEKKYRSPKYLLAVLRELSTKMDFAFSFYSKGDCENRISEVAKTVREIKQMGYVNKEELDEAINRATVLVSIGNSSSRSVPSKLIHYISFGKPILHFSSQTDDVCKEYLAKYPLALVIDESTDVRVSCQKIMVFLKHADGQTVDYDSLEEAFYLNNPQYSARLIADN